MGAAGKIRDNGAGPLLCLGAALSLVLFTTPTRADTKLEDFAGSLIFHPGSADRSRAEQHAGALTLDGYHSFADSVERIELQSCHRISAEALFAAPDRIEERPLRRSRANDPRLTLSLDSGTRASPLGL